MPAWKGNPTNPVPNPVQETIARAEKRTADHRAHPVRRDTDKQKDQKITFYDVDEVIIKHLEQMQINVTDEGNTIKVPIFYGAPEKWVAARRDGYIRDKQGKLQLPAMVLRRTNSENDDNMEMFNRYLKYPVIKKYSTKNKYTQFSVLGGKNAPVNEVFNITMADHMIFTYSFIVWTEYHEQMKSIIEKIKFNTRDYWGSPRGFRFRTRTENFTHTVELNVDDDRIVRTEFDLIVYGYILPESYQLLDRQYPTTEKLFTPKKIIMGLEVVGTDFDMTKLDKNMDKWRSKYFPNLVSGDEPAGPGISWGDTTDATAVPPSAASVLDSLQVAKTATGISITSTSSTDIDWQAVPAYPNSPGQEGWLAVDGDYIYVYSGGSWKRVPISTFTS